MDAIRINETYQSISQRVASTYRRMLAPFRPVTEGSLNAAQQADLHAFFTALYDALFAAPAQFGLPLTEDVFLYTDHSDAGRDKTEVKRVLDRPRKLVEDGLEFLRSAAAAGWLEGQALVIEPRGPAQSYLQKKPGQAWRSGLVSIGLSIIEGSDPYILSSERFPQMMPALKALAEASAGCENANLGRVFFARCDLRALGGDFRLDPLELFDMCGPEDAQSAAEMHAFFTARGYQPAVTLEHIHQWDVKYQGKKSVKASPLFQIVFDERLLRQMHSQIKIASAPRITPLIETASPALREDFSRRLYPCKDCGWCSNKKGLQHPMLYNSRNICWYVNPDIERLDPGMIALVKEYTELHEGLEG